MEILLKVTSRRWKEFKKEKWICVVEWKVVTWWLDMEVVWNWSEWYTVCNINRTVKLAVWIVIQYFDSYKCMAPGHIATVPSMASLATVDTSSSVYAPTQLLNWVYLTLADQNPPPATDQVPVSATQTLIFGSCRLKQECQNIFRCWYMCLRAVLINCV